MPKFNRMDEVKENYTQARRKTYKHLVKNLLIEANLKLFLVMLRDDF